MRFIVDAQLPKSLSLLLSQLNHDSVHTLDLPNQNSTSDKEIIHFTQIQNRILIRKDSDFLTSYLVNDSPKKLILVSTGNISNRDLIKIFEENIDLIVQMLNRSNLIEINVANIIEHE
jgi:predicted nuclease of predicted toxin-antitoxin system